jgi:hypothetical protein
LKLATANGELDEAITKVSEATRQGFGKWILLNYGSV